MLARAHPITFLSAFSLLFYLCLCAGLRRSWRDDHAHHIAQADRSLTSISPNRCLTNHSVARKREGERYRVDGVHVGGKRRRLGGWGGELAAWKQAVREMVELEANTDVRGSAL